MTNVDLIQIASHLFNLWTQHLNYEVKINSSLDPSRDVTMAAPCGCLWGRKNCDVVNGCPQTGASIDPLLLATDRISCFSHVIIVSTTF